MANHIILQGKEWLAERYHEQYEWMIWHDIEEVGNEEGDALVSLIHYCGDQAIAGWSGRIYEANEYKCNHCDKLAPPNLVRITKDMNALLP